MAPQPMRCTDRRAAPRGPTTWPQHLTWSRAKVKAASRTCRGMHPSQRARLRVCSGAQVAL
eukprot:3772321-Pyramimonas_sp.AAC.1